MKSFLFLALTCITSLTWAEAPAGWHVLSGEWNTDAGVITGTTTQGDAWLESDAFYNDFVVELEFKTPSPCNGGVQVRSHWLPLESDLKTKGFYGYQINIVTNNDDGTAGIIDKNGRGKLLQASPDALKTVNKTDWNHMRIEARGGVIATWLNGVKANHLFDEAFIGGHIALQVEPLDGATTSIAYRNIKIGDLGRTGNWRALFDGVSTKGWTVYGTEIFDVEDGTIIGRSGPRKSEGYLLTDESWTDFRVRGSFYMLGAGNYGLFYRAKVTMRDNNGFPYPYIAGVQGEVDPSFPGPSGWHYESYRRGWIHEAPQKASMRAYAAPPNTWGEIEIRCIGNRTTSWINGIRIVDFYDDNPQVFEGGFALQLHAGGADGIKWKNLYVQE